jgi:Lar family restriction alleviation protein
MLIVDLKNPRFGLAGPGKQLTEWRFEMNDKIDLKPCPFCGAQAELEEYDNGCVVVCSEYGEKCKCAAYTMSSGNTKEEAIAIWNKRHGG